MANVRLFGETSGFVQLAAPDAAGNNTITLPTTGTELVAADATGSTTIAGTATVSGLAVENDGTVQGSLTIDGIATFARGASGTPAIAASGDANTGIYFPAADTIGFTEGGNEAARIDSSGRLLVGTSSANANGGVLQLSGGITFPATAVAASDVNTLDDYEEGTWTPEIADAATGGNTVTHSVQNGLYTKVGNIVTAYFRVTWSSLGSCASGSLIRIRNFPYTAKSNSGQFYYTGTITPIDGPTTVLITGNETHGIFYDDNNPNTVQTFANLPSSNLGNGLNGTITYLAN